MSHRSSRISFSHSSHPTTGSPWSNPSIATAGHSNLRASPASILAATEILDDLGLAVDRYRAAGVSSVIGTWCERPSKPQVDAAMHEGLAVQSLTDPGFAQDLGRALVEQAGPDPGLNVLTAPGLEHDRIDTVAMH